MDTFNWINAIIPLAGPVTMILTIVIGTLIISNFAAILKADFFICVEDKIGSFWKKFREDMRERKTSREDASYPN